MMTDRRAGFHTSETSEFDPQLLQNVFEQATDAFKNPCLNEATS